MATEAMEVVVVLVKEEEALVDMDGDMVVVVVVLVVRSGGVERDHNHPLAWWRVMMMTDVRCVVA